MRGEGEKAFCAGGDVKSMYHAIKEKGPTIGIGLRGEPSADFFRDEYEMNYLLANSPIPQISFWDGIVMGGGVGVSIFGKVRIATEKTLFAMPETAIGLFPDVGSSGWLPHIPRGLGTYIALTGCKLKAADLLYSGIATHYLSSSQYPDLEAALSKLSVDRSQALPAIHEILDHLKPTTDATSSGTLPIVADAIERCFHNKSNVESIITALQNETGNEEEWAAHTLKTLERMSPSSLKLTLEQLNRGRHLSLRQCLEMEYRLSQGCMRENDFAEGVRALLVDRDNKPVWNPSQFSEISDSKISSYFASLGGHDLTLPEVEGVWRWNK
eukprot:CAMPEP_0174818868 /NCGR_PEP_ID=MMETSP1107-20130205/1786_1 /TAXON_ID=36770 /ORGANISM="Paraphysomonas vestita, Strain GFlagA" /LENGTH=326 /DNA_ID=CAMNT_0016031389 /DNA_START=207 /DNA_END=1187 /DNA_ORIENTATION=+